MEKTDFSICPFIAENMWFFTYYDFCDNRQAIKRLYKSLKDNGKLFYKWYVYANIYTNNTYKNAIWDYLNDDDDGSNLLRLKQFYKVSIK